MSSRASLATNRPFLLSPTARAHILNGIDSLSHYSETSISGIAAAVRNSSAKSIDDQIADMVELFPTAITITASLNSCGCAQGQIPRDIRYKSDSDSSMTLDRILFNFSLTDPIASPSPSHHLRTAALNSQYSLTIQLRYFHDFVERVLGYSEDAFYYSTDEEIAEEILCWDLDRINQFTSQIQRWMYHDSKCAQSKADRENRRESRRRARERVQRMVEAASEAESIQHLADAIAAQSLKGKEKMEIDSETSANSVKLGKRQNCSTVDGIGESSSKKVRVEGLKTIELDEKDYSNPTNPSKRRNQIGGGDNEASRSERIYTISEEELVVDGDSPDVNRKRQRFCSGSANEGETPLKRVRITGKYEREVDGVGELNFLEAGIRQSHSGEDTRRGVFAEGLRGILGQLDGIKGSMNDVLNALAAKGLGRTQPYSSFRYGDYSLTIEYNVMYYVNRLANDGTASSDFACPSCTIPAPPLPPAPLPALPNTALPAPAPQFTPQPVLSLPNP
ncbi:hypothetical protein BDZ45DRAFT_809737 [Acephala macrosclerotiorum]|nr:hypothetical protein BDZ45DRAFT_809737 [Acephala macrosclerotiorum]